ncbi:hypothetical protein ACLKA7_008837 [Drosophila subpalustris]
MLPLGPGPGAYALPPTVGYEKHDARKQRMPQYSFGARTNNPNESQPGPGPGAYMVDKVTRFGKGGGLEYTMAPLTPIPDKKEGPGPGAHDVHEKPFFTGVNAPAYTMAPRDQYKFKDFGPGPSAYKFEVTPIRPAAPAYSMGIQTQVVGNSKQDSPGPAAYGAGDLNIKLVRAPEYSMRSPCKRRTTSVGPGPNYYDLMYYRPGKSGQAYSFGVRHSPFAPPMIVKCDNL